jgi:phosphoenolpyruvate---glycerone phosphotransferase subunit DhaL
MTSPAEIRGAIEAVSTTIAAHAAELTALDSAIGDGDHGANMKRGFDAVAADAASIAEKPLPDALKAIGTKLVMTIGGASGPLYGTLFLALGKELAAAPDDYRGAFRRAVDAVAARGKSELGQKTMLDVLYPVADGVAANKSKQEIVALAHAAATATTERLALRGRASFLGPRSIGHLDPGARSSALLVEAIMGALP